jgi:L-alanine-DL-glutamate epimerase-like enolase superfamily enzyme
MKQNRRDFLVNSGLVGGALLTGGLSTQAFANNFNIKKKNLKMKLTFKPYTLELKHTFTIATSSRTTTPVMLTKIEYDGVTGYGEASMPPYLGESQESASKFLAKVDLTQFKNPFEIENILEYVDGIDILNTAAKASVDIALHDLVGKLMKQPWHKMWGYEKAKTPYTSFTIGIDTKEVVIQKVKEAEEYKILKVKLGRETDKMMIETIRSVTNKAIVVDVNQGWKDKQFALDMIHWLNEKGVKMVEQPMPKEMLDENAWLTEKSPLPTFGDESVQRIPDVIKAHGIYSGVNIKLMKCTGLREARKMVELAQSLNMKVMLGCMTETSCAISAVSQLSSQCEWADMDGALLIKNDPFIGTTVIDGKVVLNDSPGIGISKVLPH